MKNFFISPKIGNSSILEFYYMLNFRKPFLKDGTTATTLLILNDIIYCANIGDSKVLFMLLIYFPFSAIIFLFYFFILFDKMSKKI